MFAHNHGRIADLARLASTPDLVDPKSKATAEAVSVDGQGDFAITQLPQGDDLAGLAQAMSDQLATNREKASRNLEGAARRMKARVDSKRKGAVRYKIGDLVLWKQAATNINATGVNRKLANKFDGPFRVGKVFPRDRYLIEAIKGVRGYKRFSAVVAVDSLRRYHSVNEDEYESGNERDSEIDRLDLIDLLES